MSNSAETEYSDTKFAHLLVVWNDDRLGEVAHLERKILVDQEISSRDVSNQYSPLVHSTDDACSFLEPA